MSDDVTIWHEALASVERRWLKGITSGEYRYFYPDNRRTYSRYFAKDEFALGRRRQFSRFMAHMPHDEPEWSAGTVAISYVEGDGKKDFKLNTFMPGWMADFIDVEDPGLLAGLDARRLVAERHREYGQIALLIEARDFIRDNVEALLADPEAARCELDVVKMNVDWGYPMSASLGGLALLWKKRTGSVKCACGKRALVSGGLVLNDSALTTYECGSCGAHIELPVPLPRKAVGEASFGYLESPYHFPSTLRLDQALAKLGYEATFSMKLDRYKSKKRGGRG